jgi:hypothetical protein
MVSVWVSPGSRETRVYILANLSLSTQDPRLLVKSVSYISINISTFTHVYRMPAQMTRSAIQLAKISGFSPIIATSSPTNFDLLRSLGATHVIDRNTLSTLPAQLAAITSTPILHAIDAWSSPETQQAMYDAVTSGASLALLLPKVIEKEDTTKNVKVVVIASSVYDPHNREFGVRLYSHFEKLVGEGVIKVTFPFFSIFLYQTIDNVDE